MKAENCRYVAMRYTLSLESGQVADQSPEDEPVGFIFGSSQVLPGLEAGLRGLEPGQSTRVRLDAMQGFGEHQDELIRQIPRESFPAGEAVEPGMTFLAQSPLGAVPFQVREVADDAVLADFNHPLAGETLYFEVSIEEVRDLTAGEVEDGPPECRIGRYAS